MFKATKVWGDRVLSTNRDLDYTLFSWRTSRRCRSSATCRSRPRARPRAHEVYIPQHPGGDPDLHRDGQRPGQQGNCAVDDPLYDGYAKDTDVSY